MAASTSAGTPSWKNGKQRWGWIPHELCASGHVGKCMPLSGCVYSKSSCSASFMMRLTSGLAGPSSILLKSLSDPRRLFVDDVSLNRPAHHAPESIAVQPRYLLLVRQAPRLWEHSLHGRAKSAVHLFYRFLLLCFFPFFSFAVKTRQERLSKCTFFFLSFSLVLPVVVL